MEEKRFSANIFLIHVTSRKFWVWIISSWIMYRRNVFHMDVMWVIISLVYLIGEPIEKGIGMMFENAKLSAELKLGNLLGAGTASTVEAMKPKG